MVRDSRGNVIPCTKSSFVADTQGQYIPIHPAGTGKSGQVWYALSAKEAFSSSKPSPCQLIAKICAVKIFPAGVSLRTYENSKRHPNDNVEEVKAMSKISRIAKGDMMRHFPQFIEALISSDCHHEISPWLSMRAVRGFELQDMLLFARQLKTPLPETLVYHCYVQLLRGLEFLHNNGISKMDIQPVNVMVDADTTKAEITGLPNFVWIDFGGCKDNIDADNAKIQRGIFYDFIHRLAIQLHVCECEIEDKGRLQVDLCKQHDRLWQGFVRIMQMSKSTIGHDPISVLYKNDTELKVGGRLFNMVETKRRYIPQFDQAIIKALMDHTIAYTPTMRNKFPVEKDVEQAIKEFSQFVS
ncbi:unnamed protein product [Periconia digitata]|uniref:Protein kinase domain-containing protein n=1 Tax=Periconia digitata TaxID=1303443 RepID=A0A9W4XL15_9PLEO|nr:unnamed protein product [Periconia digitata]